MSEAPKFVQKVQPIYVDITGNVRPAPNISLPFLDGVLGTATHVNVAVDANNTTNFTVGAGNWVAAEDYYVTRFYIIISQTVISPLDPIRRYGDGAELQILRNPAGVNDAVSLEFFSAIRGLWVNRNNNWHLLFAKTLKIPFRLAAADILSIVTYNFTTQALNFSVRVFGVSI